MYAAFTDKEFRKFLKNLVKQYTLLWLLNPAGVSSTIVLGVGTNLQIETPSSAKKIVIILLIQL